MAGVLVLAALSAIFQTQDQLISLACSSFRIAAFISQSLAWGSFGGALCAEAALFFRIYCSRLQQEDHLLLLRQVLLKSTTECCLKKNKKEQENKEKEPLMIILCFGVIYTFTFKITKAMLRERAGERKKQVHGRHIISNKVAY